MKGIRVVAQAFGIISPWVIQLLVIGLLVKIAFFPNAVTTVAPTPSASSQIESVDVPEDMGFRGRKEDKTYFYSSRGGVQVWERPVHEVKAQRRGLLLDENALYDAGVLDTCGNPFIISIDRGQRDDIVLDPYTRGWRRDPYKPCACGPCLAGRRIRD